MCACGLGPKFPVVGSPLFLLQDRQGNSRGAIRAATNGSELVLEDSSGQARIRLFAIDEGAGICILDRLGRNRILFVASDATTYAALLDEKGNVATLLGAVQNTGTAPVSRDSIQHEAEQLLTKLKSGWLEGLREIDKRVP